MEQDLERSVQCSISTEAAMYSDASVADELMLILDQVDYPIAIFNSGHRLIQFNKSLLNLWKLPLTWLQSGPHWDEILHHLTNQGQLIDLQAKDIQSYLEHAKNTPCSLKVLQTNGYCLEMQITATAAHNVLLVIKPKIEQQSLSPNFSPDSFSTAVPSAADATVATQILEQRMCQQAEQLQRSENQFRAIFDNATLGIGIVGLDQRITDCNPALQQLLGYTHEELCGITLATVTHPADGVIDEKLYRDLIAGQHHFYQVEKRLITKDNRSIWVRLTVGLVRDRHGKPEFAFNLVENMTQTKLMDIERRLMDDALRWSESRYRQIVETAMEGIWVIDANSRTTFVNQMMADMLGYSINEMIGKSMFDFMDEIGQTLARNNVERRQQGIKEKHDFKFQRRDGSELWTIVSTNPLFDAAGQYIGALGMLTDITERKLWENFLQQANEQLGVQVATQSTKLQEALYSLHEEMKKRQQVEDELRIALTQEKELNQLKSRFVSMVSHEFGNPLTAIFTASQLLERNTLNANDKAEYLRMIQESVEQMNQLIEDVLLIGKAEAEKLQVKPIELDLNLFCGRLVGELQLGIGKNHHLHLVKLCRDPQIWLDAKLLRQILCNLLTNAIKYSPHGSIIQLEIRRQENQIIFLVTDEGIGIPSQDLPHLFESFNRAGNVGSITGTGLGLAIVKHCVEALEGQISITSQEGKGTACYVVLPHQGQPVILSLEKPTTNDP